MESNTLTIADSEGLKNGKAFLFLVALLCTISLFGHAACCGSYWMDVVESCQIVVEGGASSIQPKAMIAAHHINSTGFADFGRSAASSICSVINHIIGHNVGSFYIYKPFCVISRLGPVEVFAIWVAVFSEHVEFTNEEMYTLADDLVIGNWKTQVIDGQELDCFTVQLGTHRSLWITVKNWSQQQIIMQLILNSEEGDGKCRFSTVNDTYLERLSFLRFEDLEKSKPIAVWLGLKKKTYLVVCITTLLVTCVVLPHMIENGRISAASVPKFGAKPLNLNCKFEDLPSSDTNGLSSEPEPLKTEDLSKSSCEEPERDSRSSNDSLIPEKLDTIVEKEKSSRKRRKRRSSGSSSGQRGKSANSSSPLLSTATGTKTNVNKNEKKPVEARIMDENNPLFLFPAANDLCLLVSAASTMALHARAPGPLKLQNREMMNTTTPVNVIDDKYTYDMWADHLSEISVPEIWTSFFVMGPLSFKANSQAESVRSPHKNKDD